MKKRVVGIFLALCLFVSVLAGCTPKTSSSDTTSTEGNSSVQASSEEAPAIDPAFLEENPASKEKISVAVIFAENITGAKLDYLQERFGLDMDLISLNLADWQTQVNTYVSAGDSPDVLWWDVNATTSNSYRAWCEQGAFKPIDKTWIAGREELANKVAANQSTFDAFEVNDQLYYWPCFVDYPTQTQNSNTNGVWVYRRDWAKAVGLWNEDDTYTIDEWIELAKAVVAQDPGKNGAGKTIGFVTPTWGWPNNLALAYSDTPGIFGMGYYKDADGTYKWAPATDQFKKALVKTQEIYKAGLITKDNAAWKSQEAQDTFGAGMAFALSGCLYGTVSSYQTQLFKAGLIDQLDGDYCAPAIVTYNGNLYLSEANPYWSGVTFSKDISDLAMNRFLNMTNYLCSDEGAILYFYGRLGKDYEWTADKKLQCLWPLDDTTSEPDDYKAPDDWGTNMAFLMMVGGQHMDMQINLPSYAVKQTDADKNSLRDTELMNKVFEHKFILNKQDYELNFLSTPSKDQFGDFSADVTAKMADLIASSSNIEADWDTYIKSMQGQVNLVLGEINSALGSK